jgi:type IV pilus assembly protein PilF
MIKALRGTAVFLVFSALAMLAIPSAMAQKSIAPAADTLSGTNPKDVHTRAKLHTELGSLYFQDGNWTVALEELTFAIAINPNYAQAYSTRALVLYSIKELESAEKDFQKALNLDDRDPEINNNYGWFLCQIGKEKDSIAYFQRAIKNVLYQTPESAYLNAGTCYAKMGELALADEYVRKNLRFSPDNPQGLFQLANISYKRGNYDAAREHLKKALRFSNPGAEALWLSLRIERRLGDRLAEANYSNQLRLKFPDSPEYQEFLKGNFE